MVDRLAGQAGEGIEEQGTPVSRRDDDGRSHAARYANLDVVTQGATDLLSSPEAGGRVVRGSLLRGIGFGIGVLLAAGTSALLLRHLGVHDFGRYGAVAALLGIVGAVGDAGLTAIGARELSLVHGPEQARMMRNLVTLRLLITPIGILGAVVFAAIVYPSTMVWGTLLGGLGVLLVNTQATMMMPLSVELRLGRVAAFEVAKTALTFVVVLVLVVLGASLVPLLGAQIPVGAIVLAATPFVVPIRRGLVPGFDRRVALPLLREALPLAIALTMNVVYFRVLMIMVSLIASSRETGYFATSFQVFAVIFSLPLLVLSSALPLLSVAGRDDAERLRFGLQRMTEVSLVAAVVFVLGIDAAAPWAIPLLGGTSYKGAVPVLQIQAFALIPVFVGQVWQLGLLSLRRQSALTYANAGALLLVVALGAVLIPVWAAKGAAVAAVLAESGLALLVYLFLRRASTSVAPRPGLTPRIAAAAVPAFAVLLLPLSWEVELVASVGVFLGAATVLRAIPHELFHALRTR
jgi:O-antigen/teichoic acid export membrane protein